jgi:hypothetical protein
LRDPRRKMGRFRDVIRRLFSRNSGISAILRCPPALALEDVLCPATFIPRQSAKIGGSNFNDLKKA